MDKIKIYWDACVFISYLGGEQRTPGEVAGMDDIATQIDSNQIILVTSVLTRVEVQYGRMSLDAQQKFAAIMQNINVQEKELNRRIAQRAHDICCGFREKGRIIKPMDAIHLGTAIYYDVKEFQTFDGCGKKQPGLLSLNGDEILGGLIIKQPHGKQPSLF